MDPTRLVRRDASSRHDAMHVRVMQQVLSPGVQNAEEADGRLPRCSGLAATSSKVSALA